MLKVRYTSQFRRDLNLMLKRGADERLFTEVVEKLARDELLPARYRDHGLLGKYKGFRECHILPNWILVYKIIQDKSVLELSRTGTHSYLFGR